MLNMVLNGENKSQYDKGYYAGYRKATIDHLGCKCVECDERDPYKLEVHHPNDLERRSRTIKDLSNLKKLKLLCTKHHDKKYGVRKNGETEERNSDREGHS